MGVHKGVQRAQIGEFLPAVARHLVEQRAFHMHDLVVRERQHEFLRKCVQEREGELILMVAAVNWVVVHVLQDVMHPPHVPLE